VREQQPSSRITQHLHTLDGEQSFVGIKIDVVTERELKMKLRYLQLSFCCSRGSPNSPKSNKKGL